MLVKNRRNTTSKKYLGHRDSVVEGIGRNESCKATNPLVAVSIPSAILDPTSFVLAWCLFFLAWAQFALSHYLHALSCNKNYILVFFSSPSQQTILLLLAQKLSQLIVSIHPTCRKPENSRNTSSNRAVCLATVNLVQYRNKNVKWLQTLLCNTFYPP